MSFNSIRVKRLFAWVEAVMKTGIIRMLLDQKQSGFILILRLDFCSLGLVDHADTLGGFAYSLRFVRHGSITTESRAVATITVLEDRFYSRLIRAFLSLSLQLEPDGRWPWPRIPSEKL